MQTYLTDGTIAIRPFQAADVPLLFAAARESVAELSTWMGWCRPDYSLDDCADFVCHSEIEWAKGAQYSFVISDARNGAFLGSIGINRLDRAHYFANLAYWVRRSRTGQGVAPAAIRLAARFALAELGFNRLEIITAAGNHTSRRAAEKAGAQFEGILRQRLMLQGTSHDAVVYSILIEDLLGRASGQLPAILSGFPANHSTQLANAAG